MRIEADRRIVAAANGRVLAGPGEEELPAAPVALAAWAADRGWELPAWDEFAGAWLARDDGEPLYWRDRRVRRVELADGTDAGYAEEYLAYLDPDRPGADPA